MKRIALVLVLTIVAAGLGLAGAQEPTLKDDFKALTSGSGEWRRAAEKGPKWIRMEFSVFEGNLHCAMKVYAEVEGQGVKIIRGKSGGALQSEEKKKRYIVYHPIPKQERKFAYTVKDGKLILEGGYAIERGESFDLTGEWVRVEPPKKEDKK